ncbi:Hpt domain-containing protein [Vibrio profundi]|uniref:Hpt domain-containing protein n=1 Tax=Vibrio profundi TaxID=1774960 RepID=UPI0037355472
MELSLSRSEHGPKISKPIIIIFLIWLVCSLSLINLSRSLSQSLENVEELGVRIGELKQSLHFSEPLRVLKVDELALDAQLIYSIRLQVETQFENAYFLPDISQLLYVTDQFIEKINEFTPIESKIQFLVTNIRDYKALPENSTQAINLYNSLSAVVFEAMYTDTQSSPVTYRTFDRILGESHSLAANESKAVQKMLADASLLLGDYARLNYLVDRMKKNSTNEQIVLVESQFHDYQFYLLLLAIGSSLAAFSAIFLTIYLNSQPSLLSDASSDREETSTDKVSTESTLSSSTTNTPVLASLAQEPLSEETAPNLESSQMRPAHEEVEPVTESVAKNDDEHTRPPSAPPIDFDAMLDTLDGDVDSVKLLLGVFIQDHANDDEDFKELLEADLVKAARIVHSLKGVAGSLKAVPLGEISAKLELTLKNGHAVEPEDITLFSQQLNLAMKAAQDFLNKEN